jgi:hypothetical protein
MHSKHWISALAFLSLGACAPSIDVSTAHLRGALGPVGVDQPATSRVACGLEHCGHSKVWLDAVDDRARQLMLVLELPVDLASAESGDTFTEIDFVRALGCSREDMTQNSWDVDRYAEEVSVTVEPGYRPTFRRANVVADFLVDDEPHRVEGFFEYASTAEVEP